MPDQGLPLLSMVQHWTEGPPMRGWIESLSPPPARAVQSSPEPLSLSNSPPWRGAALSPFSLSPSSPKLLFASPCLGQLTGSAAVQGVGPDAPCDRAIWEGVRP